MSEASLTVELSARLLPLLRSGPIEIICQIPWAVPVPASGSSRLAVKVLPGNPESPFDGPSWEVVWPGPIEIFPANGLFPFRAIEFLEYAPAAGHAGLSAPESAFPRSPLYGYSTMGIRVVRGSVSTAERCFRCAPRDTVQIRSRTPRITSSRRQPSRAREVNAPWALENSKSAAASTHREAASPRRQSQPAKLLIR